MTTYSETWDLNAFYEGGTSDSAAFLAHIAEVPTLIEAYKEAVEAAIAQPSSATIATALDVQTTTVLNLQKIGVMLSCLTAQNTKDEAAQVIQSNMRTQYAALSDVRNRFDKLIEELDDATFHDIITSEALAPFEFILTETRNQTKLLLSEAEESIITSLRADGDQAWSSLYDLLIADTKIRVTVDGE